MEAKSSIWLAASLLFFKLVMPFIIPSVHRCIRSRFLLKNKEAANDEQAEGEETAAAAAAKAADNFEFGGIVQLPDHVIESLLLPLLPVKSLLRFRSVSKEWDYTISSPAFSNHHHIINISHVVYVDVSFLATRKYLLWHAAPIPDARRRLYYPTPPRLFEKRFPYSNQQFKRSTFNPWVLHNMSSCNGIVCFFSTRCCDMTQYSSINDVCMQIVNLATNKHRLVGELPDDVLDIMRSWTVTAKSTIVGFGFDQTINDFKIVFMFRCTEAETTRGGRPIYYWMTRVMSLKTNTWREMADYSSSNSHILSRVKWSSYFETSVAVAGGVFWNVSIIDDDDHDSNIGRRHAILKFSLVEESFELISLPVNSKRNNKSTLTDDVGLFCTLSCHGTSLYLFTRNIYVDRRRIYLWMLPMGSSRNEWNKVTSIIQPPPTKSNSRLSLCYPIGIDCNGHVIIEVDQVLHAYLLKEKKFVKLDSSTHCEYLHLVQHETLASP